MRYDGITSWLQPYVSLTKILVTGNSENIWHSRDFNRQLPKLWQNPVTVGQAPTNIVLPVIHRRAAGHVGTWHPLVRQFFNGALILGNARTAVLRVCC